MDNSPEYSYLVNTDPVVPENVQTLGIWERLKNVNFFRKESSTSRSPNANDSARLASRLYAIALPACLCVLAFFYGFRQQSISVTIRSPSLAVFEKLQALYPATISCPCELIAVPFSSFGSVSWTFHQVSLMGRQDFCTLSHGTKVRGIFTNRLHESIVIEKKASE